MVFLFHSSAAGCGHLLTVLCTALVFVLPELPLAQRLPAALPPKPLGHRKCSFRVPFLFFGRFQASTSCPTVRWRNGSDFDIAGYRPGQPGGIAPPSGMRFNSFLFLPWLLSCVAFAGCAGVFVKLHRPLVGTR